MAHVPLLFANSLRYAPGDRVRTPFGAGVVRSLSDHKVHVEVELAFGPTLYATRGSLIPEFRMLECGEIPKDTAVLLLTTEDEGVQGKVQAFRIREQKYEVVLLRSDSISSSNGDAGAKRETRFIAKDALRLAPRTRVRSKLGLGVISEYRPSSDSYVVKLDFGGVGYIVPNDVSCVDLRLLKKVPKPLSADEIFRQFEGRITREDAQLLSEKAHSTYQRVQQFCEQHAETISFLSTNATYGDQYSQALASLFDPSLAEAKDRIKVAGANELEKLKTMAFSAKKTLESELLDGKDASAFFAQAAKVLGQLKNSTEVKEFELNLRSKATEELELAKQKMQVDHSPQGQRLVLSQVLQALESKVNAQKPRIDSLKSSLQQDNLQTELLTKLQAHEADFLKAQETIAHLEKLASAKMGVTSLTSMDPRQLIAKAEELLPQVSVRASLFMQSTEKYITQMQQTTQGQSLLNKAKQLVQSVDNPDAFCENVTKAISEVKFDKLAEWGTTITNNREKRQEFVNQVKDHCLDFFMSVLPTIKIDTISGVEEGVEYSISNLDLSNFKVRKERVKVRMGTVADEELFTVRATQLTALLKGFQWTFAQKSFPYLNGGGLADAELTGGMISLGFKAEKQIVNAETGEFRPTLVLNSMEIEIKQELKITVQGSWFSAVYNLLASVFAELIREYLAKTMESKLLGHMIKLLKTLNDQVDEYWPLIFQLLDICVEDLPSASPWRGAREVDIQPNQLECTFNERERESVPFAFSKAVLNKHVVVSRMLDHEQLHHHHTNADLLRVPVGASVLAVNGLSCSKLSLDEFKSLLEKTLPVPFTVRFSLAPEDTSLNRLQRVVPRPQTAMVVFKQEGPFGFRLRSRPISPFGSIVVGFTEPGPDGRKSPAELSGKIEAGQLLTKINDIDLRFKSLQETLQILKETKKRPATLHFAPSPDGVVKLRDWPPMIEMELSDEEAADGRNYCVVSAFARVPSFAQKSHVVVKGDVLVRANDVSMLAPTQKSFAGIMETLKRFSDDKQHPMRAVFVTPEQYAAMRLWMTANAVSSSSGSVAEASRDAEKEDTDEQQQIGPEESAVDAEAAYLVTVETREVVFPKPPLGILFGNLQDEAVFIRQFISSTGAAEKCGLVQLGQAVLQICGKTVPADATPAVIEQMIVDVESRAKPPASYTVTVRDLDLERELMK